MFDKRALIVGSGGQDGAYLAQWLLRAGYDVHGTSRDPHRGKSNLVALGCSEDVFVHRLEPDDPSAVAALLECLEPREIYYLAAQSSVARSFAAPVETWRASALGIVTLLDAASRILPRARILYAASGDCFGESGAAAPVDERAGFSPRSPYAAAKCAGHHAVNVARLSASQFACSAYLFPHESRLRPETFAIGKIAGAVRRIAAGSEETIELGNLDVVRDWGWAPEYVDAMWRMLQQPEPRDFVIATGRSHPLREFVSLAFASAGLDWRAHVLEGAVTPRPSEVLQQHADPSLARRLLNWEASVDLPGVAARLVSVGVI